MRGWIAIALVAVFSVATTQFALRYLTYLEIAYVLCAVILLLLLANFVVNRWRSKNERRMAALLLVLPLSKQQAELDEILDQGSKERILKLMDEMAPNQSHARRRPNDARAG